MTWTSFLYTAAVAALMLLPARSAPAGERPLIWEFSKSSDTSYSARIGSRLPTAWDSSAGAEVKVRGPDPARFRNATALWGTVKLAERKQPAEGRSTRIDARMDGPAGKRRVSLNNSFARRLPGVDAELQQNYELEQGPAADRRLHVRTTQSVRLSSARTGTVLIARASRTDDEKWRTSIGVDQALRKGIRLSATVENPDSAIRKGRFSASYRYNW